MQRTPAERLAKALTFQTIALPHVEQQDLSEFFALHAFLKESFPLLHSHLRLEVVADAGLMYLWKGSRPYLKPIAFIAHQDVVPADQSDWVHEPFSGTIADGFVWGRGALDMKGHMMAMLEAVEYLLTKGFRPMRDIYLLLTCNEEIGQSAAKPCAKAMAELLAARGIMLEAVIDEGGSVVSGSMFGVHKDIAVIGTAEKGGINLLLRATSEGGHSSTPPNHSALGLIAKAIVKLEHNQLPASISGVAAQMLDTLAPHMEGALQLAVQNRKLLAPVILSRLLANPSSAALVRSTTAVTMATGSAAPNVLPTEATATVNIRILPGETIESVTHHVRTVVGEGIEVIVKGGNDPIPPSDTDTEIYRRVAKTIGTAYGVICTPYIMLGGTDSRFLKDVCQNIYRISPFPTKIMTGSGIHAANEKILIEDYQQGIDLFKDLFAALGHE